MQRSQTKSAIEFYSNNPCEAAHDLLGVILSEHQKTGLNQMWNHPLPILNWSRGMSKTFMVALYFCLRASLRRNVKIGIIAPSFRQEKEIIEKINEIKDISEEKGLKFLTKSIVKSVIGANEAYIKFSTGSKIVCVPIGGSQKGGTSRGQRFHIVFIDEYAFLEESIITRVAKPFLNVQARDPIRYGEHTQNQLIIASSSWFRENHFFNMIEQYKDFVSNGSTRHCVSQFNIMDFQPTIEYNLDWDTITENLATMPKTDFEMEYLNMFPSMQAPMIGAKALKKMFEGLALHNEYCVELTNDGISEYIVACDPAEVMGGDNAAIIVIKLIKSSDGRPIFACPIYMSVWNDGKTMSNVAESLRDVCMRYKPSSLLIDTRGGGAEVIKQLSAGTPKFVNKNLSKYGDVDGSIPVVVPTVFGSKANAEMLSNTLLMIERGYVRFPRHVVIHENKDIENAYKELKYLKSEIVSLRPKQSGSSSVWIKTDKKSKKKDRAVAFIMACSAAYISWFSKYDISGSYKTAKKARPVFGRIKLSGGDPIDEYKKLHRIK